jgi:hypothetical protein
VATFLQWETLVAPYVTGHSVPALIDATRDAAIDFMQRTRIDTRIKGSNVYTPSEPDMELPLVSNDTVPYQAINVWTPTGLVLPKTRREIDEQFPQGFVGETVDDTRNVFGWISLRPGIVRLVPALTVETVLRLEIAYQPKRNAMQVDDYLFDLFGEHIALGVMARMMAQRDTPYFDPNGAAIFSAQFDMAISRVADRAGIGHNKPRLQSGQDRIV